MLGGLYLAYPIDQRGPASLSYLFEQIENLKHLLIDNNVVSWIFDPGDAFTVSEKARIDDTLPTINRAALNMADAVVAFMPRDVASVGVPMEIDRARAQGKHVIVVSDADSWMLALPGVYRVRDYDNESINWIVDALSSFEPPQPSKQYADLPVKLLVGGGLGQMPKRSYDDDAGLDLFVSETVIIEPNSFMDVPTSVAVQLPPHTWGLVTGRSSAFRRKGLMVVPGVIDAGYRGELFSAVYNVTNQQVRIEAGERVAQLIVLNNATRYLTPVEYPELLPSPRGSNGFGSSGS